MKVLIYFFSLIPFFGIAQTHTITARILDSQTKQPIRNAAISTVKQGSAIFSNYLGYFQTSIATNEKLAISHIGYITGEIQVPENNSFTILLKKKFVNIGGFDLSSFPLQTESSKTTLIFENEISSVENSAIYKDNWQSFYEDLGGQIVKSPSFDKLDSIFEVNIMFTINDLGKVDIISIIDIFSSYPLADKVLIKESLLSLDDWTPATQNGIKSSQSFVLRISRNTEIYTLVEQQPYPVGGMQSFYRYIYNNLEYPVQARRMGIEGKVFVQFRVEKNGKTSNIKIIKGIGAGCDKEATRLIQQSPNWNPGFQRGKPVIVRMVLPITFKLDYSNHNSKINFSEYLGYNVRYPSKARRMGIEGTIYTTFEVRKGDSTFSDVQILNDIGGGCGDEIIRVIKITPASIVKRFDSNKIHILPVTFGLESRPSNKTNIPLPEGKLIDEFLVIAHGASQSMPIYLNSSNSNNFRSIEDAISKNANTQRLTLSNKGIKDLSPRISELEKLKYLDIEKNNISVLPTEITKLDKLEELYLPYNLVAKLPYNFSNLQALRIVGIAENKFSSFPVELTKLPKLEALDLSNNEIYEIPREINNLKKLKILVLNNTKIKSLPDEIYELKKLEQLYLIGTLISKKQAEKIQKKFNKTEVIIE